MTKARVWLFGLGGLAGVLGFGLVRLAFLPEAPHVHYHANWAVVVDGRRLDLSDSRYMEDVATCKADPSRVTPEERVHLHNGNADVVHVHHAGATWGHLLANLGFGAGDEYLITDTGQRYFAGPGGPTLKWVLNGIPVPAAGNRPIGSGDRLLISFGPERVEDVTRTQFPRVASNALEFNTRPDPAGCSGNAESAGFGDKLKRAFWF